MSGKASDPSELYSNVQEAVVHALSFLMSCLPNIYRFPNFLKFKSLEKLSIYNFFDTDQKEGALFNYDYDFEDYYKTINNVWLTFRTRLYELRCEHNRYILPLRWRRRPHVFLCVRKAHLYCTHTGFTVPPFCFGDEDNTRPSYQTSAVSSTTPIYDSMHNAAGGTEVVPGTAFKV